MGKVWSIISSIIAAMIVAAAGYIYRRHLGQQIVITSPREHDALPTAETLGGVVAHAVQGSAKNVPEGHKIWLIVANAAINKLWPQGFFPVQYDEARGTWKGYVHAWGWNRLTVIAVIAPPTTQDYFNYYQQVGNKTEYAPIFRIPPECPKRRIATLHTQVPKM
jgi:hypothetical protein